METGGELRRPESQVYAVAGGAALLLPFYFCYVIAPTDFSHPCYIFKIWVWFGSVCGPYLFAL